MQVPFTLDGPDGILRHLQNLMESKTSAVICVAEGAGQVSDILCLDGVEVLNCSYWL
jgi:hypothetical protein